MIMRLAINAAALLLGAGVAHFIVGPPTARAAIQPLELTARPVQLSPDDPAVDQVGKLGWRGGIALSSPERRFGGVSDLRFDAGCGRFLAVSDTGAWLIFAPVEDNGRLLGITAGSIAPIRDERGNTPARKADGDSEAIAITRDGNSHVWFERDNRAQTYPGISACTPESLAQAAAGTLRPAAIARWPANGGPEAADRFWDGQFILAEAQTDGEGRHVGHLLDARGAVRADVTIRLPPDFQPTGLAQLGEDADGVTYLLLLRRFSPLSGVAVIVMRVTVPAEGGEVEGEEIARLRPPLSVDNMEGIAVRKEGGRTMVYLVSDNNFNMLQRTLLMKFELLEQEKGGNP